MDEHTKIDKERKLLDGANELLAKMPETLILCEQASATNFWKDKVSPRELLQVLLLERFHKNKKYDDYVRCAGWAHDPDKMRLLDYVYEKE